MKSSKKTVSLKRTSDFTHRCNSEYIEYLDLRMFADVIIVTQDLKEVHAHKVMLAMFSPTLKKYILSKSSLDQEVVTLILPDYSSTIVLQLLKLLYSGKSSRTASNLESIRGIMKALNIKIALEVSTDSGGKKRKKNLPTSDTTSVIAEEPQNQPEVSSAHSFVNVPQLQQSHPSLTFINKGPFSCPLCPVEFRLERALDMHLRDHGVDIDVDVKPVVKQERGVCSIKQESGVDWKEEFVCQKCFRVFEEEAEGKAHSQACVKPEPSETAAPDDDLTSNVTDAEPSVQQPMTSTSFDLDDAVDLDQDTYLAPSSSSPTVENRQKKSKSELNMSRSSREQSSSISDAPAHPERKTKRSSESSYQYDSETPPAKKKKREDKKKREAKKKREQPKIKNSSSMSSDQESRMILQSLSSESEEEEDHRGQACIICLGKKRFNGFSGKKIDFDTEYLQSVFHYACCYFDTGLSFRSVSPGSDTKNEEGQPLDTMGREIDYKCHLCNKNEKKTSGWRSYFLHMAYKHLKVSMIMDEDDRPGIREVREALARASSMREKKPVKLYSCRMRHCKVANKKLHDMKSHYTLEHFREHFTKAGANGRARVTPVDSSKKCRKCNLCPKEKNGKPKEISGDMEAHIVHYAVTHDKLCGAFQKRKNEKSVRDAIEDLYGDAMKVVVKSE